MSVSSLLYVLLSLHVWFPAPHSFDAGRGNGVYWSRGGEEAGLTFQLQTGRGRGMPRFPLADARAPLHTIRNLTPCSKSL